VAPRILTPPWPLLLGTSSLLAIVMVASFTPTPLYPLYQEMWGLSDGYIGVAFTAYPASVVFTLIFLGGLSDRFGRRDTLIISTCVLGVALVILAFATVYPLLVLGRFVQGIAVAMAAGAGAATLMESHPEGVSRGALLNTLSVAGGSAVGPLLAGFLAGSTPIPLIAPYLIILLFLPVPLILLARSADVFPKTRDARLVRPIRLPRSIWAAFSVAGATVLGTNLCMGIYGSFGSNIAGAVGWNSEVQRGLLVSLVLFMVAAVQPFNRNLEPKVAMFVGLGSCAVGWALVTLAAVLAVVPVMVIGSMLVGAGAGLCLMGSAALVGEISPIDRRAEIYSSYLIVAFMALGITALISGPLIGLVSITAVVMAASVTCTALMAYVIYGSRRWLSNVH
jgi:MFS family permease